MTTTNGTTNGVHTNGKTSVPSDLSIPLIDFSSILSPSLSTRRSTSQQILSAFQTHGFLYLSHLPIISPSTLSAIFSHSASFFARPQFQKDALAWTTPSANRGYVSQGKEKASQSLDPAQVAQERIGNPDLKESIEIGREGKEGQPNRFPDWEGDEEGKEFKRTMQGFFLQCKEVHRLVMSAIALGLGLEEGFFDEFVVKGDNNLRLLHYPPVKKEVFEKNKGQVRAGAHTDYGSVTLLWQDGRGGLQVETKEGVWKDVTPVEGTVVVNAGDLLSRWSNDLIKSTKHRVVEPPVSLGEKETEYPARYSVVYFCNPDYDKMIEAIPGTYGGERGGKKYEGVLTEDYLVRRLQATY